MKFNKKLFEKLDRKFSLNPHDALVRGFLDNPKIAKSFIKQCLPKNILAQIDFSSLKVKKDSFIHKDIQNKQSDILYSVILNNKKVNIYVLIEHKSYVDENAPFQMLNYMSKIWEKDSKNNEQKKVIIPILFYHSDKEWNFKTNFNEHIINDNLDLTCCIPKFNIYYFNLNKIEKIIGKAELQLLLMILKYKNNPEIIMNIEKKIFVKKINDYYIVLVANYLNYTTKNEDYDNFIYRINNTKIGVKMVSIMEYKEQEGELRKQMQIAKKMLKFGEDIKKIALFTGLSIDRIKKLQ